MSSPLTPDRARDLLEAQITELGELRNAHGRDSRFKQWRQATLTVIQRIWPGDVMRAERFRRIPFSPPSNRMSLKVTRSFFEKGGAEAIQLIRSMIPELVEGVGPPPRNDSGPAPDVADDDYPMVELPEKAGHAAPAAPVAAAEDDGVAIPPAPMPAPASPARNEPGRVSMMKSTSKSNDSQPPLREMLGFSSRPLDEDDEAETESSADLERTPILGGFEAEVEEIEWEVEVSDAAEEVSEAPPAKDEPGTGTEMEEFLRSSPVLKASARPVKKRDTSAPEITSPAAASLVALASEVAHLGVPEGQRAGMRATLIELARRVEGRSLDWDSLRGSFHAVLDFPPLARRVIPLLIPYLDAAA